MKEEFYIKKRIFNGVPAKKLEINSALCQEPFNLEDASENQKG